MAGGADRGGQYPTGNEARQLEFKSATCAAHDPSTLNVRFSALKGRLVWQMTRMA